MIEYDCFLIGICNFFEQMPIVSQFVDFQTAIWYNERNSDQ